MKKTYFYIGIGIVLLGLVVWRGVANATTCSGTISGYGIVLGADGKCWLDRNLGATEVATSSTDTASYGDLYQWGRLADGHQITTSGTTATLSSTDVPGNSNFIVAPSSPNDWRSPQNDSLWQGVSGTNNPCPTGFRLPTQTEWATLAFASGITNSATAFSSALKLPLAGYRYYSSGSLYNQGRYGFYWSSSVSGTSANYLYLSSFAAYTSNSNPRGLGAAVRCISDTSWPPSTPTIVAGSGQKMLSAMAF